MAATRVLERLLRVLTIEEELAQRALETALAELRRLVSRVEAARERERAGRRLVMASVQTGEVTDRLAGLEEVSIAARSLAVLRPRIAQAEAESAERRQVYLGKRVERRQAETLIREAETQRALEEGRRSQRSLDDWHLERVRRAGPDRESGAEPAGNAQRETARETAIET